MKNDSIPPLAGHERHLAWFGFNGLDQIQTDRLFLTVIIIGIVFHSLFLFSGCVGIEPLMTDH